MGAGVVVVVFDVLIRYSILNRIVFVHFDCSVGLPMLYIGFIR